MKFSSLPENNYGEREYIKNNAMKWRIVVVAEKNREIAMNTKTKRLA